MRAPLLTTEEVLAEASARGLSLTERTLRYYALQGLIEAPTRGLDEAYDKRVRLYPAGIIERLEQIRTLQDEGYSLRKIRDYLGISRVVCNTPDMVDAATPTLPDLAPRALLEVLAGHQSQRARQVFLETLRFDRTDTGFRSAATTYLISLLTPAVGPHRAPHVLQEAFADLSPVQIDQLLQPLRAARNQSWIDEARRRGLPLIDELRRISARVVAGQPLTQPNRDAIAIVQQAVADTQQRLETLTSLMPDVLREVADWSYGATRALSAAISTLDQALQERRLADIGAALGDCETQGERLGALVSLLDAYARLA